MLIWKLSLCNFPLAHSIKSLFANNPWPIGCLFQFDLNLHWLHRSDDKSQWVICCCLVDFVVLAVVGSNSVTGQNSITGPNRNSIKQQKKYLAQNAHL